MSADETTTAPPDADPEEHHKHEHEQQDAASRAERPPAPETGPPTPVIAPRTQADDEPEPQNDALPPDYFFKFHERARTKGVNMWLYRFVRLFLLPFFLIYFRLDRIGREHVPTDGPIIFASNHRSFLDPFIIGSMTKRPLFYVAKMELFKKPLQGWFLNSLGAIPVMREQSDQELLTTVRALLDRGDSLVIFPEGTRIRPGSLGRPRRGVGRFALETGVPIVPIALIGTEDVRKKWRVRPHKVSIRAGDPLVFPHTIDASKELAVEVTDRIWPRVELQWEWLGGLPPMRRAAVIGSGAWGTAVAVLLAKSGMEVELGTREEELAQKIDHERRNERYLPEVDLPPELSVKSAATIELSGQDLIVFAVPSKELPNAVAQAADRIGSRSAVLVLSKGLVPPLGTLPSEYVGARVRTRAIACLGGPAHAAEAVLHGASVVLATPDDALRRQLGDTLEQAGLGVERSRDLVGTELAGCAKNVAALAASAAGAAGMNAAGAAAGHAFSEVEEFAGTYGAAHETFLGLAGTGDLVATVLAAGSRNRRAGELLGSGVPADQIKQELGHVAEAVDTVPLLATVIENAGFDAPTVFALRDLINGEIEPAEWVSIVRRAA
ncbi:MAG: 1-acyl-sn-glycerol-3-phosphate acyltransferase [Thermoleophilaceae bacterium]|nr:1-acyl-sn-glycerol-3-phosphate acyltransferase [Thermoleophilaceae bacterium]